jgi:hypothetical protein
MLDAASQKDRIPSTEYLDTSATISTQKLGIPKICIFAGQTQSINLVWLLQTIKSNESCHILLIKIALLAVPALMNAPLKRSRKAIFTKLILRFAQIVVHVQMYALWKQFTRHNTEVLLRKRSCL